MSFFEAELVGLPVVVLPDTLLSCILGEGLALRFSGVSLLLTLLSSSSLRNTVPLHVVLEVDRVSLVALLDMVLL
jgi:hypothetical protein